MNGILSIISNLFPFVPSIDSGRALSPSKDERFGKTEKKAWGE